MTGMPRALGMSKPVPPATLFEKIWRDHVVKDLGNNTFLVYIDRNFLHEVSGAISFKGLAEAGRSVRRADLTYATIDHVVDTFPGRGDQPKIPRGGEFIRGLREGAARSGVTLFDLDSELQGIVHVISPALGIALPGSTLVCGDSHTCTVGGIGALAWGIGSSDSEHVLATQTLVQTKPAVMRVDFDGIPPGGVTAKDMILHLIGRITADGGNGYAIEYAGAAVSALSVEGRLTLCNMAIELSARTGMVAPDDVTFEYLCGTPFAPQGEMWERAIACWRALPSDPDATFDRVVVIDCTRLAPQVTWGTSPEHVVAIDGVVPDPAAADSARARLGIEKALAYTGLTPGTRLEGLPIEAAFIGSCTNSRLSDLRAAAAILEGRKVAPGVKAICTPGSTQVKRQAEAEGIDRVFKEAGFEWRESGCSLCMSAGASGETFGAARRVISSTNRNFENRQGRGVTSFLASPATVALSAVNGCISDVRKVLA
jgi:3-isopropylmalate/(R)-2-methylmalate dehydratase large subunit